MRSNMVTLAGFFAILIAPLCGEVVESGFLMITVLLTTCVARGHARPNRGQCRVGNAHAFPAPGLRSL
jgi:hypothetical protein